MMPLKPKIATTTSPAIGLSVKDVKPGFGERSKGALTNIDSIDHDDVVTGHNGEAEKTYAHSRANPV